MTSSAGGNRDQTNVRADGAILTKAVLRAATRLALSNEELACILGLSETSVSRMRSGEYAITPQRKPFERALLLVRLHRSLDSILGGDAKAAKIWLRADNGALGGPPIARITSIAGLVGTITYLDSRSALA